MPVIQTLAIASILFSIVLVDRAAALPFMFPNCQEKPPPISPQPGSSLSEIDGGVRFSQDCSTLYVNPPASGTSKLTGMVVSANISSCPAVENVNQELNKVTKFAETVRIQAYEAFNNKDFDTFDRLDQTYDSLLTAVVSLNTTRTELARPEGLQANVLLQLSWEDLVKEYRHLNSLDYFVQPLPIVASFITFNDVRSEEAAILTEAGQSPTALEIDIPGLQLSGLEDFNIIAPPQENALVFGNSLSGFVRMSLVGACPFYNSETGAVSPINPDGEPAGASLVANFTYFYRVGIEATYKLTFEAEAVGDIVLREVQSRNGIISAQALSEELFNMGQSNAFSIYIYDPTNLLHNDQLEEGFRARVRESFAHDLLSKFAEVTAVTELPADQSALKLTGHREETRTQRHCRRAGLFGLFKSCSDHVYTVKIPVEQVKERVRRIIADDLSVRYSEEGRQVSSILEGGTAGLIVVAE